MSWVGKEGDVSPEVVLRAVAEEVRGNEPLSSETRDTLQRRTEEEGFGRFDDAGTFQIYSAYLEDCFLYQPHEQDFDQLLAILDKEALEAQDRAINLQRYQPEALFIDLLRSSGPRGAADRTCKPYDRGSQPAKSVVKSVAICRVPDYSIAVKNASVVLGRTRKDTSHEGM